MPLDDQLMRQQTDAANEPGGSAERAGTMRQQQRSGANSGAPTDLRSARMAAIRAKKDKLKGYLTNVQKSLSFGSSKFLQAAWRNLIPSLGFSFFGVYAHLFLQQIFGKRMFAPLGEEWFDKPNMTMKARERAGRPFKVLENFGVGCLTIVLLIAIIFAFAIPALIIEVFTNPLRTGVELLKMFSSWLKGS